MSPEKYSNSRRHDISLQSRSVIIHACGRQLGSFWVRTCSCATFGKCVGDCDAERVDVSERDAVLLCEGVRDDESVLVCDAV